MQSNLVVDEKPSPVIELSSDQLEPYLSNYLNSGYRDEIYSICGAKFHDDHILGTFAYEQLHAGVSAADHHLSMLTAMNCIGQLAIAYACLDCGMTKKSTEFYLRKVDLQFNKVIRNREFKVFLKRDEIEIRRRARRYWMSGAVNEDCIRVRCEFAFLY